MKVLMIYPEYPATFWSFKYALTFIGRKAAFPPLGLLTVSKMLPESWEKRLIDMNVKKLNDSDIEWADYVFVSAMIVQKKSVNEIIKRVKKYNKFIVAGGPLFTTGHNEFSEIDCFVLNEGEITIPEFIKDLEKGQIKKIYTSDEKPDISKSPIPDWKLINTKNYASLSIQISRGCPFNCEFCDIIIMNGRIPRIKTAEQVIQELNAIYDTGCRSSVFVVDDNFIGNKQHIKLILKSISEWMKEKNYPFTLFTEASVNLADEDDLMQLMRDANFNTVFVGIETPEEESLLSCGKIQNTGKNLQEKVKILQRNGFQVQGGFIVGFDTDTNRTFDNMIKFIQNSGIVTAMVGILSALPQTQLYKRLQEAGRIIKFPSGNNTDINLNFIPKMDKEKLIEGYKKVLNSIFNPDNYYNRIITFLREYKKFSKSAQMAFDLKIKILLKVIWKLGIWGKGKIHFWKMFFWTLFKKPHLLQDAITLSILGFHYRKVFDNLNLL